MASGSARRAPPSRHSTTTTTATSKRRGRFSDNTKSSPVQEMEQIEDTATANTTADPDADVGDHLRDDRSSSLSDPEDVLDQSEGPNGVDSDAVEGEELPVAPLSEVDSEAETERLSQTPQKLRKNADNVGRTPSKLSQAALADDEDLSDPPSPLPAGAGAASSTSTVATVGQKRKRSETADSPLTETESELGESPRKRSHEMTADEQLRREDAIEDTEPAEEAIVSVEEVPMLEEAHDTPPPPTKGPKGRKPKRGRKQKEQVEEPETDQAEEIAEATEEVNEEDAAKTEEQQKAKKEASALYEGIAKHFRNFQEQVYTERVATLTAELDVLAQPECMHPDYLRQVACVDGRRQKQIRESHAYYNYKLQSIRNTVLGERSQLHSQYFQMVRQLREDTLYQLGEEWYAIQKERREAHQLDDANQFVYLYNPKRGMQLKQQAKYNLEVSILAGIAQHVGFPAAPDILGVDNAKMEDDLRAMKITKRQTQPISQPRPLFLANPTATKHLADNDRLAHEQYLEQNPWARPQAPIYAHGTPGISHTPDWADNNAGKHMRQNPNLAMQQNSSPFATPLPQQAAPNAEQQQQHFSSSVGTIGVNSDEVLMPSSVVAAPPTVDRLALLHQQQSSPLSVPKTRENGVIGDPPGFRNISGVSGVSTIDAPQDGAVTEEPSADGSRPFPTGQMHRFPGDERKEVFAGVGFRT